MDARGGPAKVRNNGFDCARPAHKPSPQSAFVFDARSVPERFQIIIGFFLIPFQAQLRDEWDD
jgi:hypothetical protein